MTALAAMLMLAACHDRPNPANAEAAASANRTDDVMPAGTAPAPAAGTSADTSAGAGGFQPLGSQAVKDAIHLALNSGTTQRWQDGTLSGYAVPSQTADAHGCRAVRYTIDQQPDHSFPVITACDAGK